MKVIFFNNKFFLLTLLAIIAIFLSYALNVYLVHFKNFSNNSYLTSEESYINLADGISNERFCILSKAFEEKKLVMLSFDDGPSKYTLKLLDILQQNNAVATFFILGKSLENNPRHIKRDYKKK